MHLIYGCHLSYYGCLIALQAIGTHAANLEYNNGILEADAEVLIQSRDQAVTSLQPFTATSASVQAMPFNVLTANSDKIEELSKVYKEEIVRRACEGQGDAEQAPAEKGFTLPPCHVCQAGEHPPDIVLVPCGHTICSTCGPLLETYGYTTCNFCKAPIASKVRLFGLTYK